MRHKIVALDSVGAVRDSVNCGEIMQAACTSCGTQHALKDEEVKKHPKVRFRCSKCGETTVVDTKPSVDQTMVISPLPSFARANASSSKPRVILGRQGADLALKDPEISRHHCVLEVRDNVINLKDMDSTNGTFYDEERVRAAMLQDGSEFRVGTSIIRVNFVPK
jgi:predicted RNA-binding Zn-ribbon protein involved in translation (DUF1610 family)